MSQMQLHKNRQDNSITPGANSHKTTGKKSVIKNIKIKFFCENVYFIIFTLLTILLYYHSYDYIGVCFLYLDSERSNEIIDFTITSVFVCVCVQPPLWAVKMF